MRCPVAVMTLSQTYSSYWLNQFNHSTTIPFAGLQVGQLSGSVITVATRNVATLNLDGIDG